MDRNLLETFANQLRERRQRYLEQFRRAEADLDVMAEERESELEEHAQEEQSALLLKRMDERSLHAMSEIDAALQRIVKSNYGMCEACGEAISIARLHVLPATRYCTDCEAQSERQTTATPSP